MNVIFKQIPQILFEPVAIGACLGILTAMIAGWRKRSVRYWMILFAILFMIGWRVAIQTASARYSAVLICPAVILTVYFCFRLEFICRCFVKSPRMYRLCRFIPYLVITGLVFGCIIKIMRFDAYSGYVAEACRVYLADRSPDLPDYIYCVDGMENTRISYYSKLDSGKNVESVMRDFLRSRLKELRNIAGVHYFYAFHKKGQPYYTAENLELSGGEWRRLGSFYTSKRRNKEFVLYKYIPDCLNAKAGKGTDIR